MNQETALDILGLASLPADSDDLIDQAEEVLFPIREYFLRNPVVAILYKKRIRQLERIRQAMEVLDCPVPAAAPAPMFQLDQETLTSLLRSFETASTAARLHIASSTSPTQILEGANLMIQLQEQYEAQFLLLTTSYDESDQAVKASEHLETGVLLLALRNENLNTVAELIARERKRINGLRLSKRPS